MPRYFFNIEDGHRLLDPAGSDCESDKDAIEKAKVLAVGVALDKPEVDPKRRIAVVDGGGNEISSVPVYSKASTRVL